MYIREAKLEDAAAIAKIHVNSWQTTYQGLLPKEYIAKRTYDKRFKNWQKRLDLNNQEKLNHFTYMAEVEQEIVGFIDGGMVRGNSAYEGEIYALYILEAYQRRGIGRNLVQSIAPRLYELGLNSIMVWVLERNPAVQFYQALGGQRIDRKVIKIGDDEFGEIAYGWRDVQILLSD